VNRPAGVQIDPNNPNNQRQQQQRTAVLAIAENDTTKLMLGSSLGDLRLALHGQSDEPTATDTADAAAAAAPASADGTGAPAAATASKPARKPRPEKVITSAELVRLGTPDGIPRARIEVIRGNDISAVSVK